MRTVTIDLNDMKKLIRRHFERDVRSRAEVSVLNRPGNSNAQAAFEFDSAVREEIPAAQEAVGLRYRSLNLALDSGEGVSDALKEFVYGFK